MTSTLTPELFLQASSIEQDVLELRPDYRAMLIVIDGLTPDTAAGKGTSGVDDLVQKAEAHARELIAETAVTELAHIAAWREAYRAFGAKPQRTRNSLEALTRRAEKGLPRINAFTDTYNSISVLHQIPFGGEDFSHYQGPARLIRAKGDEPFDTTSDGESVIEYPEPGEVAWCDSVGVTCRRWNWRQGTRTSLMDDTTTALFILDALGPVTDDDLIAASEELTDALSELGTTLDVAKRLIGNP